LKYRIEFKKSVTRDLRKIGKQHSKKILDKIEKELSVAASQYPELKGKFAGLRKLRIGDYRVIFSVIGESVLITRIAHRKEVYKKG
jgi:mRNA interferase RelE/StbE